MKRLILLLLIFHACFVSVAETYFVKLSDTTGFRQAAYHAWGDDVLELVFPFSKSTLKFIRNTARISISDTTVSSYNVKKLLPTINEVYPRVVYHTFYTPNDSLFSSLQWNLSRVQSEQAWELSSGEPFISMAVLDDAIDISHKDLRNIVFVNNAEIPGNGVDDDNNGYTDDYKGYDVSTQGPDVTPPDTNYKHGTHVAGIMVSETGNISGVASLCFRGKLLPVKCTSSLALGLTHGLEGIVYAVDAGARVINMSWGSPAADGLMQQVIDSAYNQAGIVFVAAAGNTGDTIWNYPAAYPNVISVAATGYNDEKLGSSTYGSWVSIAAPGQSIISTLPGNRYGQRSGTSMAAPLVSSAAGLLLSYKEYLSQEEVKDCLINSSDPLPASVTRYGKGRLNAYGMLLCARSLGIPSLVNQEISLRGTFLSNITSQTICVSVYSILGNQITAFNVSPSQTFDVSELPISCGLYFLCPPNGKTIKCMVTHGKDL